MSCLKGEDWSIHFLSSNDKDLGFIKRKKIRWKTLRLFYMESDELFEE